MSRIYLDFEFLEDGKSIDPISLGIVGPDGREYYAVNWDANWLRAAQHPFVREHVLPHLPLYDPLKATRAAEHFASMGAYPLIDQSDAAVKPRWVIANEAREFILGYPSPRLWGDDPCFDHVALAWLYGDMTHWPKGLPFSTYNLQQDLDAMGNPELDYDISHLRPHHALDDARATKIIHEALLRYTRPLPFVPSQESGCPQQ